ncbi:hypothetical protein [Tropicimonas aquimaris]|uniref:Sulfotransferase family protein n=1 Tax=Tropicimonas aquimaris TaxID=914152 RepID=A0ABW3IJF2_9RHOB
MRAVVHIGLPKTGTTSIQGWLLANADRLPERGAAYDRINYPDLKRRRAHVELGICQMDRAGVLMPHKETRRFYGLTDLEAQAEVARVYTEVFGKAVKRGKDLTWIFSSEDLGSLTTTPELAKALDGWMGQFFSEVRYVCYIRRQEDWLLSRYSQTLRHGATHTLDEFLENAKQRNYHEMGKLWCDAVGSDRFVLRLLEPDAMKDGDLIADFADAVGIDHTGLTVPPRKNEALSVAAAEFLRQANVKLQQVGGRRAVTDLMRDAESRLMQLPSAERKLVLTAGQIASIREANEGTNRKLREDFFPQRSEMFPPKAKPAPSDPAVNQPTIDELCEAGLEFVIPTPASGGGNAGGRKKGLKGGKKRRATKEAAQ